MSEMDPIMVFLRVREEAVRAGEPWEAAACALATVGDGERPAVRMVLSKEVDAHGFRIYTNLESRKGRELSARPRAAIVFHWDSVHTQFRIEGPVEPVPAAEADAYFAGRPIDSQLGAWASAQSRPLASREELETRLAEERARFGDGPIPRPPHWGGLLIVPERVERWIQGDFRLHHRTLWVRDADAWTRSMLWP